MPKHYKATCCTIHMPEDADTASKANPNDEEPLMQEGVTCAETVCVEDLHHICALPDPRTLDNGLDLQARPCPRRDEIRKDEERALQLLACPEKIDYASVLKLLQQLCLKPQINHRRGINHGGNYVSSWLFGAWCHGGSAGVSRQARERPYLTRVLASLM